MGLGHHLTDAGVDDRALGPGGPVVGRAEDGGPAAAEHSAVGQHRLVRQPRQVRDARGRVSALDPRALDEAEDAALPPGCRNQHRAITGEQHLFGDQACKLARHVAPSGAAVLGVSHAAGAKCGVHFLVRHHEHRAKCGVLRRDQGADLLPGGRPAGGSRGDAGGAGGSGRNRQLGADRCRECQQGRQHDHVPEHMDCFAEPHRGTSRSERSTQDGRHRVAAGAGDGETFAGRNWSFGPGLIKQGFSLTLRRTVGHGPSGHPQRMKTAGSVGCPGQAAVWLVRLAAVAERRRTSLPPVGGKRRPQRGRLVRGTPIFEAVTEEAIV